MKSLKTLVLMLVAVVLVGCSGRAALTSNPDPTLRKPTEKFAADAAKRSYKADAPRGDAKEAPSRAEVTYGVREQIAFCNLSKDEDYKDIEIWVNKKYVIFLPTAEKGTIKRLDFLMLYDNEGNPLQINKDTPKIDKIEMLKGGKMYDVTTQLAD